MNEELLRKSLTDSGLSEDKVNEVIAAQKAAAEPTVPVEALQKSLDAVKDALAKAPEGVSEAVLQEEIKKAIEGVTDSYAQHAKEMGVTTDLLVKAMQGEMADLRKSLVVMADVIGKVVGGYEQVQKSLNASNATVAEAAKKDPSAGVMEAVKKALDEHAPLKPLSVDNLQVMARPGDPTDEPIKKSLSADDITKALRAHPDGVIANRAAAELFAGGLHLHPDQVLNKYGIKFAA